MENAINLVLMLLFCLFLPYSQLKGYLSFLLEKDLIEEYQKELEEKVSNSDLPIIINIEQRTSEDISYKYTEGLRNDCIGNDDDDYYYIQPLRKTEVMMFTTCLIIFS